MNAVKKYIAEFIGTFVLVFVACGTAAAIGCDKAVLISDRKFAGADTYATGKTIASAIKSELPDFDLIVCGQFAVDGDTAQTGPCIAEFLNIPQVTYTKSFEKVDKKLPCGHICAGTCGNCLRGTLHIRCLSPRDSLSETLWNLTKQGL